MIKRITNMDLEREVEFVPYGNVDAEGIINSYDNTNKIAWVIYKCGETGEWLNHPPRATDYKDLKFKHTNGYD
jgi:hypothetical protein